MLLIACLTVFHVQFIQLSTLEGSHGVVPETLAGENLRQEEREAVSTLLGFSENPSQFNGPPFTSAAQDLHGWGEPEYYVKYANRSHMYNEWVNESTLCKIAKRKLINFKRRYGDSPVNMFVEEWAEPERLVARRKCRVGPGWELLVKWKELGYEHCTWEVCTQVVPLHHACIIGPVSIVQSQNLSHAVVYSDVCSIHVQL